jgi:carboxylate/amino acid/amine transporter
LTVPEVLLFTILTPLHVTLIEDALNRRFNPWGLLAALVAVLGAVIIRYDRVDPNFLGGFLLLQLANFTYAAGQVLYKHLVARHPSDLPHYRRFGYFYLGALAVALPAFLLFGNPQHLPDAPQQWVVLLFLGLCSTALGMYWWNKGACLVNGATLAVMNNLHVPVGLLINLLIWGQNEDLGKLFLGGLVIVSSVWISRRGIAQRRAVL